MRLSIIHAVLIASTSIVLSSSLEHKSVHAATPLMKSTSPQQAELTQSGTQQLFGNQPLCFIENHGQIDNKDVLFYVKGADKTMYFTSEGITFALQGSMDEVEMRWAVKLAFIGTNPDVNPSAEDKQETIFSYFKGNPEQWRTGIPAYSRLVYKDLWPGIDLVYSGTVNQLKYEFIVYPGSNPDLIRLAYDGATEVSVRDTGSLDVKTPLGGFEDGTPYAYQMNQGRKDEISARYRLEQVAKDGVHSYCFDVGEYDPALPLVLDPTILVYCGYIGGINDDLPSYIAVDSTGCAYVAGRTSSIETTFPVHAGPDLTYNGGDSDAFVAKVDSDGSGLIYCGYIGGDSDEYVGEIAVDSAGCAYVVGDTNSTEATFPVNGGPDLTYNGGGEDAFVAKVGSDGSSLVYCGYIGGAGRDSCGGITMDNAGYAYVSGATTSTEITFPVTVGPDLTYNGVSGDRDVFVAKVDSDGSGLSYCGYIGGMNDENSYGIAVDGAGCVYVSGGTYSTEATFPVTVGPDLTQNGDRDGFVAKVTSDGSGLIFCGYIGGEEHDYEYGIAVDGAGCAYVSGGTDSTETTFPVTVGPDLTFNGGGSDVFVAKVMSDGSDLIYCGYIGGMGEGYNEGSGGGIAVDSTDCAYVSGCTNSTEATFPVTVGPDLTFNGISDAFVAKMEVDGSGLVYCGYIGGVDYEQGWDIAVDSAGSAYVTGHTASTETTFPVNVGPDLTHNGGYDVFVAKVSSYVTISSILNCVPASGTVPFPVNMSVGLTNEYEGLSRRMAGHLDVQLAGGNWFPNWRSGYTNVGPGQTYSSSWLQTIPALGAMIGDNIFTLIAEDVTPSPYNRPPYPPSGDADTATCTVTGIAP